MSVTLDVQLKRRPVDRATVEALKAEMLHEIEPITADSSGSTDKR